MLKKMDNPSLHPMHREQHAHSSFSVFFFFVDYRDTSFLSRKQTWKRYSIKTSQVRVRLEILKVSSKFKSDAAETGHVPYKPLPYRTLPPWWKYGLPRFARRALLEGIMLLC